jgi:tetratricopeptide (TPR) repeat protein
MARDRQDLLDKAERLASRGKLNAAITEFRKVIDAYPQDTSTLNRVGDLYVRLKRIDDAIELFRLAAENFEHEGFFVKAIAIYKKILRIDISQLEVSECLADLQHRQGLLIDARRQYQAVADNYQTRGDIESAVSVLRKLIDVDPEDPGHRLHLAELLKSENRVPEAMGQYKGIADVFLERGLVEEAVKVCLKALALAPQNTDFIAGVARGLNANGHTAEAEGFLNTAAEQNPEAAQISLQSTAAEVEEDSVAPELEVVAEDGKVDEAVEAVKDVEAAKEVGETEEAEAVEVVEAEAEAEDEDEEEFEFEIDLEEFEFVTEEPIEEEPAVEVEAAAVEVVEEVEEEPAVEVEAAAVEVVEEVEEEPAVEVEAAAVEIVEEVEEEPEAERLKELLIEAEVLARYELLDKAIEKYEEIIVTEPTHRVSYQKLVDLLLEQSSFERVAELALAFRTLTEETEEVDQWESMATQLTEAGFKIKKSKIVAPEPVVEEAAISTAVAAESEVFDSEGEFFDLASELERELDGEAGATEELEIASDEQSIEEIVEGFRKGMAETLSPEDYDTHYNLGIAYREMGLADEAISEFQLAAKDSRYLIDCCSLLASCFVEKGFPELAVKWYNEGLDSPTISQEEVLGLQYELGDLYLTLGEAEEARQRFVEIYGVNSDYRDVSSKLASLEQSQ